MNFGEQQSDTFLKKAEYKENIHSEEQELLSILNSASEAALRQKYLKAEALLKPLIDNGNCQIEVLDLMAKIYAQQGKYQQAQKLWLLLLENEPTNLHYISALKSCATQQKPNYFIYQYL